MEHLAGHVSDSELLHAVFVFFLSASIFTFILGVGLAARIPAALRFNSFMNRWLSLRKLTRPLMMEHSNDSALLRRPVISGVVTSLAAALSVLVLKDIGVDVFRSAFFDYMPHDFSDWLAAAFKWFLIIGNGLCIVVGLLMIFSHWHFSGSAAAADKEHSLRKQTLPLDRMHVEFDNWVMAHPTVAGTTLSVLSLGIGTGIYARLHG